MTIELPNEAQQFVQQQLATGRFADESAVLAHALDVWQKWQKHTAEVRAGVQQGLDDVKAGRGRLISTPEEAEALKADIIAKGKALRAEREQTSAQ